MNNSEPSAISAGFTWHEAKHQTAYFWSQVSDEWRSYLRDAEDYGYDAIDI
jgi:hypothetical protein